MHRLERLAVREAKEVRDTVPELLTATDCLRRHMLPRDWNTLQSFNDKLDFHDLLEHFALLRNWLIDSWFLRDWGKTNSSMNTGKMREEAEKVAERVKKLSKDIEMLFPELCEPYSIHTVVEPLSWIKHLDWIDPSNSELPEINTSPYPIAFDPRLATTAHGIEADCTESEPESKDDLLFRLAQEAGEVAAKLKGLSRYGLTPAIAGKSSLLDHLHSYIAQNGRTLRAPPAQRTHPTWCRYATFRLANKINKSDFFELASKAQKYRVIEYSILATADYHGLESPSRWGPKQIERHAK
jgi:hypothetical protein